MTAPDVLVVGGGPAGLTAATALARRGVSVLVLEREVEAGGIPRHSDHTGYGLRDLHRVMSGPSYARRLVASAAAAGVTIRTEAMVTGWSPDDDSRVPVAEVTSPAGRALVEARAVVLATGARERARPARMVPGDRPQGVLTTGELQNLVHLKHAEVGKRAVVVGAELVSWSAVLTLREAGCRTVLMTSAYPRAESYAAFTLPGRTVLGVDVATRTRVVRVVGKGRVEGVEVEGPDGRRVVDCDTVVFTGDWVPDHELARLAGVVLDPGTKGPRVDTALRTSRPGVFAAGNLLHPVDTADVAALDGRHVASHVAAFLAAPRDENGSPGEGRRNGPDPAPEGTFSWRTVPDRAGVAVPIVAAAPFRWVAPQVLVPDAPAPPRGRLLLWTDEFTHVPRVLVRQDGRTLSFRRVAWPAAPGRVFRLPWSHLDGADPGGGPISIGLT